MKKSILAAFALLFLASCATESSTTGAIDSTAPVAVTFTAASITRMADNTWEESDQIGITMTTNGTTELADGDYYNVLYTADAAGVSGTFTAADETIYFPTDGSLVDFYAYYPYATLDADNNIEVDVSSQIFTDIDIVAATATAKSKTSPTVKFTDDGAVDESFKHQLSKLTLTLKAGDGITDLAGLTTTIKGQYTTAKYNLYTGEISGEGDIAEITAVTTSDGSMVEAILIPTTGVASSSILFTIAGNDYIWDTADLVLVQGSEHNYEITVTKTLTVVEGATISGWSDGADGTGTAE